MIRYLEKIGFNNKSFKPVRGKKAEVAEEIAVTPPSVFNHLQR
jgi:hypothetical protein